MPPAARITDMHTCPMVTGIVPHVGGPILPPGAPTVLIDFLPAATVTTMATCVGPPDIIVKGSAGVFINFLPAARIGDLTAHGGVIVLGSPTCIIGEIGSPSPGAGGLGGVVAGMVASGATNFQSNPSQYSSPGAGSDDVQVPTTSPDPGTPEGRMDLAKSFYAETGWSEERISQHLRGIDFNQPVEVITLKKGDVVKQWVDPKSGIGSYFDADSQPEELGICPVGIVSRDLKSFVVTEDTKALKSTAAPIRIDWLGKNPPIDVQGGAAQHFVLPKDKSKIAPDGLSK
jgi:uncharacterized Zn-binding protein involved in type VI secretion